ncbi:U3 small nucleolar RNA-associated protein 15 [Enteropsectra breve]|nr:U3 small nucleolar RNA-associated protein 15 [Enteropsectra breve]
MYLQSNNYQLKNIKNDIFTEIHKNEFEISGVVLSGSKIAYSSRNEVFMKEGSFIKKIAGFESDVTHLSAYDDLLCVGTHSGAVQIFGSFRKAIRTYAEHEAPVVSIALVNKTIVISADENGKVNFYNLSDDSSYKSLQTEGTELVANSCFWGIAHKELHLYSMSDDTKVAGLSSASPISNISFFDDSNVVFSENNRLCIFNIKDNRMISKLAHTKGITKIVVFDGMIYTASADGHLKTWNSRLELFSNFNLSKKITDFAVANGLPVVALKGGRLYSVAPEKKEKQFKPIIRKKFAYEDEIQYETLPSAKRCLTEVDSLLRQYSYKGALKYALEKRELALSYRVLKYVQDKKELRKALADGDKEFLKAYLEFCVESFAIKEFTDVVADSLNIITTLYHEIITENSEIFTLIHMLNDVVAEEVAFQEVLQKGVAFLDCFE